MFRLAYVASHPIQYQAPVFRALTESGIVDLEVLFLSDFGIDASFDPQFGRVIRFDVALTEGYSWRVLPNLGARAAIGTPLGAINPSLVRELTPSRYDAVVVQGYGFVSSWIAMATARATGLPYFMRGETQDPDLAGRDTRWLVKRAVLGPMLRGGAGALPIGLRNAAFYLSLGLDPDKVFWAPYAIDNDRFARGGAQGRSQRSELLSGLGLDAALPVILFAAKLRPLKRIADIVAACDRLGGKATLLVIGDGEERDLVETLARTRPWMCALGFVNQAEIAQWYGVADLFVLASESETWGLVVNEAMAAGAVPVVSEACGCAADLVAGGAGRIFPVGDVAALAAAFVELLDPTERERARRMCQDRIARYSITETVAGFGAAVRSLSG